MSSLRRKSEVPAQQLDSPRSQGDYTPTPTYSEGSKSKNWFGFGKTQRLAGTGSGKVNEEMVGNMQRELEMYREQVQKQEAELADCTMRLRARDTENNALQAAWNFQNFKYQLLVDMWAMRVLDNEELGASAAQSPTSPMRQMA